MARKKTAKSRRKAETASQDRGGSSAVQSRLRCILPLFRERGRPPALWTFTEAFFARTDLRNPKLPLGQWLEELPEPLLETLTLQMGMETDAAAAVVTPLVMQFLFSELPKRVETFTDRQLEEASGMLYLAVIGERQRRDGFFIVNGDPGVSDGGTALYSLSASGEAKRDELGVKAPAHGSTTTTLRERVTAPLA